MRRCVKVLPPELSERRHRPELRHLQPQTPRHVPHRPPLRTAAHAAHRKPIVHSRPHTRVEQVRFHVDLPVRDRDNVRRHVRRNVPRQRLHDRQCRQRPAPGLVVEPHRPFEQARMQVEHIPGVRLPARRAPQEQRHLAVRPGVLGQIVVHDQRVLALVHEILRHRTPGIRRQVLQRSGVRRIRRNNYRVLQRPVLLQRRNDSRHLRRFLPDRHVHTRQVAALLVDDAVHTQHRLPSVAVSDDQLPLAPSNRHQRVHCLDAELHRLRHRLPRHHSGRDPLNPHRLGRLDRTFPIDRLPEGIHHPSQQPLPHRHLDDTARAPDLVPLFDRQVIAQDHRANPILLQVQRQTRDSARKLQQLVVAGIGQTMNAGDAVPRRHNHAHVDERQLTAELLDLPLDHRGYVLTPGRHSYPLAAVSRSIPLA